jgi:hypothetical protein
MFADDAPPLEWEEAGERRRYTRAAVELYYAVGAAKPLGGAGAGAGAGAAAVGAPPPREAQERALAHALHWGWPDEEEEEEEKEKEKVDEQGEDGDGAAWPRALAAAAGGRKRHQQQQIEEEEGGGALVGGRPNASRSKPRFARVDAETLTLAEALLLPGHVVAGVPVFWVVARGTEYHARWLREALSG